MIIILLMAPWIAYGLACLGLFLYPIIGFITIPIILTITPLACLMMLFVDDLIRGRF